MLTSVDIYMRQAYNARMRKYAQTNVKPCIEYDFRHSSVNRGETAKREFTFYGDPPPDIKWFREEKEIVPSERINIVSEKNKTTLTIRDAVRKDSAKYTLKLTNSLGSDSHTTFINIFDKPTMPLGPVRYEKTPKGSIILGWEKPKDTGGLSIRFYKVDGFDGDKWLPVAIFLPTKETYTVKDLTYKCDMFRVIAVNSIGESPPLHFREFKIPVKPSVPRGPLRCEKITKDSIILGWMSPENPGGQILSYQIDVLHNDQWLVAGTVSSREETFIVKGITEITKFRVIAINEDGESEPLYFDKEIKAHNPHGPEKERKGKKCKGKKKGHKKRKSDTLQQEKQCCDPQTAACTSSFELKPPEPKLPDFKHKHPSAITSYMPGDNPDTYLKQSQIQNTPQLTSLPKSKMKNKLCETQSSLGNSSLLFENSSSDFLKHKDAKKHVTATTLSTSVMPVSQQSPVGENLEFRVSFLLEPFQRDNHLLDVVSVSQPIEDVSAYVTESSPSTSVMPKSKESLDSDDSNNLNRVNLLLNPFECDNCLLDVGSVSRPIEDASAYDTESSISTSVMPEPKQSPVKESLGSRGNLVFKKFEHRNNHLDVGSVSAPNEDASVYDTESSLSTSVMFEPKQSPVKESLYSGGNLLFKEFEHDNQLLDIGSAPIEVISAYDTENNLKSSPYSTFLPTLHKLPSPLQIKDVPFATAENADSIMHPQLAAVNTTSFFYSTPSDPSIAGPSMLSNETTLEVVARSSKPQLGKQYKKKESHEEKSPKEVDVSENTTSENKLRKLLKSIKKCSVILHREDDNKDFAENEENMEVQNIDVDKSKKRKINDYARNPSKKVMTEMESSYPYYTREQYMKMAPGLKVQCSILLRRCDALKRFEEKHEKKNKSKKGN